MASFLRLACLFVLLALPACGDGEQQPRSLRIGNSAEPATLDPHRAQGVPERNIQRDLFEGLLRETADGGVEGGVAERWSIDDNGRRYTFHLREAAQWSNGDPVTAKDFVFSLRRATDPATGGLAAETLYPIRNARDIIAGRKPPAELAVQAIGDHRLVIELEQATPYFLQLLAHPSTFPVHPPSVAAGDDWTRPGKLVSNGAYQLVGWRVQSDVTLERNPHYWQADQVSIERVQYLPIEDLNAELARFAAGEIDITYSIPAGRLSTLRQEYGDELRVSPWFGTYFLGVNTTRPPLDRRALRRALALAINRDVLARDVAGGGEIPAYRWVPPLPGYAGPEVDWEKWSDARREAAARRSLEMAGLHEPLQLELLYNTRDRDQRIVTAIAAMWRRVLGIETRLRNEEWKVYLQSRRQLASTQVFRSGWIGDYPDPLAFAEILHSEHGMNEYGWANPDYDALLDAATRSLDSNDRSRLLREAEGILLDELPIIPLFHYSKARLVSPSVAGYRPHPLDHHYSRNYRWSDSGN